MTRMLKSRGTRGEVKMASISHHIKQIACDNQILMMLANDAALGDENFARL